MRKLLLLLLNGAKYLINFTKASLSNLIRLWGIVCCSLNILEFGERKFEVFSRASFREFVRLTRRDRTYLSVSFIIVSSFTCTQISVTNSTLTMYKFIVCTFEFKPGKDNSYDYQNGTRQDCRRSNGLTALLCLLRPMQKQVYIKLYPYMYSTQIIHSKCRRRNG